MRDFSWKIFAMTGDVESYLLYKEMSRHAEEQWDFREEEGEQEEDGESGNG